MLCVRVNDQISNFLPVVSDIPKGPPGWDFHAIPV